MSKHKLLTGLGALAFLWAVNFAPTYDASVWIHHAAAAGPVISDDILGIIASIMSFAITVMDIGMWVLFKLLDIVMDPATIFGINDAGQSGILLMMHEIWTLSRDLVNLFFAILLVVGTIITIVQAKGEIVKQYASKFVMAVVFVNFSWFVPQVIFDFSQVAAYTVYQIPNLIPGGGDCQVQRIGSNKPGDLVPCEVVTNVLFLDQIKRAGVHSGVNGWYCPLDGFVCYQSMSMLDPNLSASPNSKILNGLIINHARLRSLVRLADPGPGAAAAGDEKFVAILTFIIKMMMVLILHVALFFPMLALLVGFFIRIPILWLTMAFMPFVFLEFVVGNKFGEFSPTEKLWKGFLSAAFLPAMVGIPFAIGFVLLNAGNFIPPPTKLATSANAILPVFSDISTFWQLLWMMLALGILWTGVFQILNQNKFIGGMTEQIRGIGESLGKFAAKAPLAAPILPVGGVNASPLQLMKQYDPRNLERQLSATGNLRDLHLDPTRPGSSDTAEHARAAIARNYTRIQNNVEINTRFDSVKNNLDTPTDAHRTQARELVDRLKGTLPDLNGMSDKDILKGYGKQRGLTDEQLAKLERLLNPPTPAPSTP